MPSRAIRAAHRQINWSIIVPSPGNCRVSLQVCSYSVAHYRCAFHSGIRPVCRSIVGRTTLRISFVQPIGPAQSGYDYDRHDDGLIASKATYVGYNLWGTPCRGRQMAFRYRALLHPYSSARSYNVGIWLGDQVDPVKPPGTGAQATRNPAIGSFERWVGGISGAHLVP